MITNIRQSYNTTSRLWQKRRLEILNQRGLECELCGSTDDNVALDIHHKWYAKCENHIANYPDECLQVLCRDCHQFIERLRKKYPNVNDFTNNILSIEREDETISVITENNGELCLSAFYEDDIEVIYHAILDNRAYTMYKRLMEEKIEQLKQEFEDYQGLVFSTIGEKLIYKISN